MPEDQFDDVTKIGVAGDAEEGLYRIGVTLVDPVTGDRLAQDFETFKVKAP